MSHWSWTCGIFYAETKDKVIGGWRKRHKEELHNLYCSLDSVKPKRGRWAGHVACMGEKRNAYRILVDRAEGKRRLGRPRLRGENNIRVDIR
jgi:hypothetical protein